MTSWKSWCVAMGCVASLSLSAADAAGSARAVQQAARAVGGVVRGSVTDAQGAMLPGATVSLTHASTRQTRVAVTDDTGGWQIADLAPGTYVLRIEMAGFAPYTREALAVEEGGPTTVDARLELGELLETVVVTGTRSEQQVGKIPAAVTVVAAGEVLKGQQTTNINEVLKRVPGVAMRVHMEGSTRATASIRGAGAQSTFGARGVRILVDGVPKNNAGGSGQDFINIDLGSVDRVEVVRGPSSALYGNQSGGVINFITQEGPAVRLAEYRQTLGSFGLRKEQFRFGGQRAGFSYFGSVFRTDQRGYRALSDFRSTGFHGKLRYTFDDGSSLTSMVGFETLRSQIPGTLTAEEMAADPRQANPALAASGGVPGSIDEFRSAVTYQRHLFGQDQIEVTGYYVPRPIYYSIAGPIRNSQFFINRGLSARYMNGTPIGRFQNRVTVGVDYQNTPLRNTILNRATATVSQQLEENLTAVGAYVQDELTLGSVIVNVGGRFDRIRFGFDNLLRAGQPGAAFVRDFERFTPKLGAVYRIANGLSLYGNYSEGLETPVSEQLRNSPFAAGEFVLNQNLSPMIFRSGELGAKGQLGGRVSFEMAWYRQDIDDFIVTRQILRPDGQTTFTASLNAAAVRQQGFELGSSVHLGRGVSAGLTYTWSDFTFSRFEALGDNLTGNRLAGIPTHDVFVDLRYRHASGLYGGVELKTVSEFFVDDANRYTNRAYQLLNVTMGYEVTRGARFKLAPFLTINNLLDERYSSLVEVNNGARRFYNPMPGVNVVTGASVRF